MVDVKRFETGYIPSGTADLYAAYYPCTEAAEGVLLLSPFGEERKCAYRLATEFAALVQNQAPVMRFDLSGTGESTGDHAEASLSSWEADAETVLEVLRERAGVEQVAVIGARLGANLALRLSDEHISRLVLWEPLLTGDTYLDELLRRKQIKEMMGGGRAESLAETAAAAWESGVPVDFDGFPVGAKLSAELRELDLKRDLQEASVPVLLLHVSGAKRLTGAWPEIAEILAVKPDSELRLVRQKPFWGLADYQKNTAIKDPTANWLGLTDSMKPPSA